MRSRHKLAIVARRFPDLDGKRWISVEILRGNRFVPSFEDLFRIVRGIVYCEREKYAGMPYDAADLVKKFLARCVERADQDYDEAWASLAREFEVPDRCGPHAHSALDSGARTR